MGDQREPVACEFCDEVVEDCVCAEIVKAVEVVADNRGTIRAALLRRAHPPETEALVEALREITEESGRPRNASKYLASDYADRLDAIDSIARRALEAYEGGQSDEG